MREIDFSSEAVEEGSRPAKHMPEDGSIDLQQVLAEEYDVLRPGSNLASQGRAEWLARVHGESQPLSALCISGGGIRSATFALGAIQGLAEQGLLNQFDYLSTVSGGGYIGSWLTAWIKRAGGLDKVIQGLCRNAKPPGKGEPDPIGHLRDYNNYLSPKMGFFSADAWTLFATVIRNIILNWLVLVPLLLLALMVPRLLFSIATLAAAYWEANGTADPISTSPFVTVGLPALTALLLACSLFNTARYLPGVGGKDHSQGDFLAKVLAPLVGAVLCFCAFNSLYFLRTEGVTTTLPQLIVWVMIPNAAGCMAYVLFCPNSFKERLDLVFGPLPIAVALMVVSTGAMEWVLTSKLLMAHTTWAQYVTISPPLLLLAFDLAMTVFVGLSSTVLKDEAREWLARSSAWTQLFCVTWAAACALVLLAPGWAFQWQTWAQAAFAAAGVASGWVSRIAGASAEAGPKTAHSRTTSLGLALKLAPAAFLVTFAVGLSVFTNWLLYRTGAVSATWWDHDEFLMQTGWRVALIGSAILFSLGWVMARFININRFSLQGMYRNRLIRAYMGASNPRRNASQFTGFAESDNLLMRDLRTGFKPFHVVNMSLNLVKGARLAWQQRKAQSFTVSPLHSGNYELGYRDSAAYAGDDGITLGTAVAISGAAASPNMGYHSSPIVGFIMTLFNARLGSWLGNPGEAGADTWKQPGPRSAVGSLLREALGMTTNTSPYVYLSDGGHFENLGLYEMVLRRCRYIVVLDSGCDPAFNYDDLGNAVRKIRIDLRIPIDFPDEYIQPMLRRENRKRCAVGTIRYSEVDGPCPDGLLIYIKPMRLGDEPPDVESYAVAHAAFPHQSTGDQWFDESQTESYRMLGLHTLDKICRCSKGGGLAEFAQHVQEHYLEEKAVEVGPASIAAVAGAPPA